MDYKVSVVVPIFNIFPYLEVIARIYPKICLKQKIKNMIFVFRNSKKMS